MKCSQVKAILFEYADTEIPEEFRQEVEEHLAVCSPCAIAARSLDGAIRRPPRPAKGGSARQFLDQVRSRLEKPSVFSGLKNRLQILFAGKHLFKLAGAAATAVLVIVIAQVALRDSGHKALVPPAPPSVESPPLPGAPPSAEAPAAPAARPQSLPDIRRENGKALNRAVTAARPALCPGH